MAFDATKFVTGIYHALFGREPDVTGLSHYLKLLQDGMPAEDLVKAAVTSPEFVGRQRKLAFESLAFELPNLIEIYPDHFREESGCRVYVASDEERINRMEQLISVNGYYDQFGVWSAEIDNDKRNMAELVECLGAKSCMELGCFNGPLLSLLNEKGIDVTGVDPSHLAFVVAFPNIRRKLMYGDLSSVKIDRTFDCIILLDVLEHVNPLKLDEQIRRLSDFLAPGGVIILNSPMLGEDPVFGTVFSKDLEEWRAVGDGDFYKCWPCDERGWPIHGHMILASPKWWDDQFGRHGLTRLTDVEACVHDTCKSWFTWAPARKSFFILGRAGDGIDANRINSQIVGRKWF